MHQIPKKALGEFFRVIKPGRGVRWPCTKYDHPDFQRSSQSLSKRTLTSRWNIINKRAFDASKRVFLTWGALQRMLEKQGFFKTSLWKIWRENIKPMYGCILAPLGVGCFVSAPTNSI